MWTLCWIRCLDRVRRRSQRTKQKMLQIWQQHLQSRQQNLQRRQRRFLQTRNTCEQHFLKHLALKNFQNDHPSHRRQRSQVQPVCARFEVAWFCGLTHSQRNCFILFFQMHRLTQFCKKPRPIKWKFVFTEFHKRLQTYPCQLEKHSTHTHAHLRSWPRRKRAWTIFRST